ncbi:amidohydrolase family protein [Paenibacillus filicis]|uniref:Amidohydrolase family protein n=1 Tax=Paenibacillus gyeongsangnamensis TaxID=3388067 RepID=A0ABT4QGV7_9BACL|nr:amidohydrolase family protein [Paenibacillus filicis]MCZ8516043.1 amidohydrolase family protein [Paenibacillus filicis]
MSKFIDVHCTVGEGQDVPFSVEELLEVMDQYGIEKAVLSPSHQQMAVDNEIGNNNILTYKKQYPDRLLGYATVNPWYGRKAELELERALDAGLSGVKFHPALQGFFAFDSGKMDPLMKIAEKHQVPVYFHTGTPVFALPLQVAELAMNYPSIPIILGRMGNTDFWIDTPRAFAMANNIYVDTPYTMPNNISKLADIDINRILFSADLPYSHAEIEMQKIVDIGLDASGLAKISRDNFYRIFGNKPLNGGVSG